MDSRFGFKDFVMVMLILVLIAVATLNWFAADRQGGALKEAYEKVEQVQKEVSRLREQVEVLAAARAADASVQEDADTGTP